MYPTVPRDCKCGTPGQGKLGKRETEMATKTYDAAKVDALRAKVAELCEAIVLQHRTREVAWMQMVRVETLSLEVSNAEAHLEATDAT